MTEVISNNTRSLEAGESLNRRAWLRFRENLPAMVASVFLIILIMIAICWPFVSGLGNQHSDAQFHAPGIYLTMPWSSRKKLKTASALKSFF